MARYAAVRPGIVPSPAWAWRVRSRQRPTNFKFQVASVLPSLLGRGVGGEGSFLQAKAIFDASLKEYPKGSWHDETLRELALLIERAAAEQFGPPK